MVLLAQRWHINGAALVEPVAAGTANEPVEKQLATTVAKGEREERPPDEVVRDGRRYRELFLQLNEDLVTLQ